MMRVSSSTARHMLGGVVLAFGIAFLLADISAFDSCDAGISCGGGGKVRCGCDGPGSCDEAAGSVACYCDGFPGEECTCETGCNPV